MPAKVGERVRVPRHHDGETVHATFLGPVEGTRGDGDGHGDGDRPYGWVQYHDGHVTAWPLAEIQLAE